MFHAMVSRDLQPDIITFTGLVRAHQQAEPLHLLEHIWKKVKDADVQLNVVFTENFLVAAVQLPKKKYNGASMIAKQIAPTSDSLLRFAQGVVSEFEQRGTPPTELGRRIVEAIMTVQEGRR